MFSSGLSQVQAILELALGLIALGVTGFALFDAARQPKTAFTAAGKLTKPVWLSILAVATMIAIIMILSPLQFFTVIAVVAAGVYLADVRPALRRVAGGGASSGPYGDW